MDFDNAKENIQPLATGRNASILQAALNVDLQEQLSKQRESLENAITSYEGNDPLQPWFEYVSWIEQSYPSGGTGGGFKKVLLKCLENFETDDRYFQDIRLIRIYIKFIDSEDNPQELYQELFNAGIGTMLADFYICWAYYYDVIGNFKQADKIFRKGIELRAQPHNQLIQAHKNFGFSMSQRMLYEDDESKAEFLSSLQKRRHALTSLRGSNVGSIRIENQIKPCHSGTFPALSGILKSSENVGVLVDCPDIPVATDIEASKSIVRNIIECTRNQENKHEPGPWSKSFSIKRGNLFKGSKHNNDVLGFTILEDDLSTNLDNSQQDCPFAAPLNNEQNNFRRGIQLPVNFMSKNHYQESWILKAVLDNDPIQNAIPAYRKNYHYPKMNYEFSLEEYLAYRWFKKRKFKNNFFDECNKFWNDEYSVGIRLYPNFASKCFSNNDTTVLKQEILSLTENLKLAVNYNKLYPTENLEMQFEEILCEKWHNNNRKTESESENTFIIHNVVSDSLSTNTQCNFDLEKCFGEKKKNTTDIKTVQGGQPSENVILENKFKNFRIFSPEKELKHGDAVISKRSTTNVFEQYKLVENKITNNYSAKSHYQNISDNFNIKVSELCQESVNENVKALENKDILTDFDYLAPNESCSTHQFNFFIKAQSVSTPISKKNPICVIKEDDENIEKNELILSTSIPLDNAENHHTFPIKQLSTILELSESNTVKKSSVDTLSSNSGTQQFSNCNSNPQIINTDQKLFTDLKSEKKSVIGLLKNRLFDKENHTKSTPKLDKSCSIKLSNTPINLSFNPINFFEEKTENVAEVMQYQQRSVVVEVDDEEIFQFLSKTPEKKGGLRILNNYRNEFDDFALKSNTLEFDDLTLPTFNDTGNISQPSKITESLVKSENNVIPFSFIKPAERKSNLKQITTNSNQLISLYRNDEINSKAIGNFSTFSTNIYNGKFVPHIINDIFNKKYLKGIEKEKYKSHKLLKFKKIILNNFISNTRIQIFKLNNESNEEKLSLFTCCNLKYNFLGILAKSELIRQPSFIDINKKYSISEDGKLICRQASTVPAITKNEEAIILRRFSIVPFESEEIESSRYLGRSIYLEGTPKSHKFEQDVAFNDDNEYENIKSKFRDDINLDLTIDYISDQVRKVDVNPFSLELMDAILQKIDFYSYIEQLESCELTEEIAHLRKGRKISINNLVIEIITTIGEGAYGTVFRGEDIFTGKRFALKQEKPPNLWEYYICLELLNRLQHVDILCGFMDIKFALIGNNASVFVTELSPYGSLIAVCNKIKRVTLKNLDEYIVMVIISQILVIIDHLHASEIIHADIKPENFLLMRKMVYGSKTPSIKLIDFGVSIDLKQFPIGQQFTFAHKTPEFRCVEMRENRPWSYQIDLYGVATIIHVLLFGKHMEIHKASRRTWTPKQYMPRYLNKRIWDKIFTELLNIRDANSMPNLQDLRAILEQEIVEKEKYVKDKIWEFNRAMDSL